MRKPSGAGYFRLPIGTLRARPTARAAMPNATLTLTDSQREALAACYRYILGLNERRKQQAADGAQVGSQTPTAADTPTQEAGGAGE
jgi:hypothetical protein